MAIYPNYKTLSEVLSWMQGSGPVPGCEFPMLPSEVKYPTMPVITTRPGGIVIPKSLFPQPLSYTPVARSHAAKKLADQILNLFTEFGDVSTGTLDIEQDDYLCHGFVVPRNERTQHVKNGWAEVFAFHASKMNVKLPAGLPVNIAVHFQDDSWLNQSSGQLTVVKDSGAQIVSYSCNEVNVTELTLMTLARSLVIGDGGYGNLKFEITVPDDAATNLHLCTSNRSILAATQASVFSKTDIAGYLSYDQDYDGPISIRVFWNYDAYSTYAGGCVNAKGQGLCCNNQVACVSEANAHIDLGRVDYMKKDSGSWSWKNGVVARATGYIHTEIIPLCSAFADPDWETDPWAAYFPVKYNTIPYIDSNHVSMLFVELTDMPLPYPIEYRNSWISIGGPSGVTLDSVAKKASASGYPCSEAYPLQAAGFPCASYLDANNGGTFGEWAIGDRSTTPNIPGLSSPKEEVWLPSGYVTCQRWLNTPEAKNTEAAADAAQGELSDAALRTVLGTANMRANLGYVACYPTYGATSPDDFSIWGEILTT